MSHHYVIIISGRFDIPLIKRYMVPELVKAEDPITMAIKSGSGFLCLQTEKLRFLDVTNFLAAGVSYADYLKAFEVAETKLSFPHDAWNGDLSLLERTDFPKHEEFYSKLKGCNITEEEYQACHNLWNREGMTSMEDLLVKYCNADVIGRIYLLGRRSNECLDCGWLRHEFTSP